MSEPSTTTPPVRLEMSRSTKVGCAAVIGCFIFLAWLFTSIARSHGSGVARVSASRIYRLAQARDYASLQTLASPSALGTLQKAEQVNGMISGWQIIRTSTDITGRPSMVSVETTRDGKEFVDEVAMVDNVHAAVIVEFPKEDWEQGREDRVVRVIAK